ncbi:hypothetical protein LDENG_00038830 [Lucifuga dentata]|nr:hypothetical protein LDENG_00038830 [Lucifuga dentata]
MHTDLNPENIMMVSHRQQPPSVKIIDFGLAQDVTVARPGHVFRAWITVSRGPA